MALPGASDGAYIRACTLCGFAELVKSKGGDPIDLLERAGIDPRALGAPEMLISFVRKGALLEMASEELGSASLGLEWALAIPAHFPNAGPMLLLKETTATFGEWFGRSTQYWRLGKNGIVPQIINVGSPDGAAFRIALRGSVPVPRQQLEYLNGKVVRLSRAVLMDDEVNPFRVRFSHSRPQDTTLHDLIFRCPVEFDADQDEILFDGEILERPLPGRAASLERTMDQFLRSWIGLLPRYNPSVSTSTSLAIKVVLGAGICSKEFIARALRSSPRSCNGCWRAREQHMMRSWTPCAGIWPRNFLPVRRLQSRPLRPCWNSPPPPR